MGDDNGEMSSARRAELHDLEDAVAARIHAERLYAELRESEEKLRLREAVLAAQKEAFQATVKGAPLEVSLGVLVRTLLEREAGDLRWAFYVANSDRTELHHVTGMPDSYAECVNGFKIGAGSLACGLAVHTNQPVLTSDVTTEPLWQPWLWLAERYDFRGCWSFPIELVPGEVIGSFAMYFTSPRVATARDLEWAGVITSAAAIIIARHQEAEAALGVAVALRESEERLRRLNEELEERVHERTAELQAQVNERSDAEARIKNLLRQLVNAEEQERRRIARELHDTLGQQLAALHLNIEVLKSKAHGDATVDENLERMRETFDGLNSNIEFLAWELRPPTLDLLGLDAAIESYVGDWGRQFGVEAMYQGFGVDGLRLSPEAEINVYRILQEALQNVHKHAGATRVHALLERRNGQTVLIVEDNGKGYDVDATGDGRDMGLTNMRERAALIGGTVEIETQPGYGTTVFVRVPVN